MINYYNPLIACLGTRFKKSKGATIGSPPTSSKKTNRTSSWQMMFLLLFAVFSGSVFAQTTITIGGGASTAAANNNGNPIYRSSATSGNNFAQSVHLLTAADLTAAGLNSAKDITSMAFFKSNAFTLNTGRTATLKIYMKSSTATTLGIESTFATWVSGATLVYSNTSVTAADLPSGAVTFPFSAPFQYYGTDGIEIAVDWKINTGTGNPATGGFTWAYDATTNVQAVGVSYTASLDGIAVQFPQSRRYKMNLTLANTTLPVCATPAPGNVTGPSAACAGVNFTLGLQNATSGIGVTYLWQSADNLAFTSNVATVGGSTPILTTSLTSSKYYRCTVSCATGPSSTVATPIFITLKGILQCYCAPTTSYGCSDGDVIAKVILNTLVNDSGTGCPSDPVPGNNQVAGENGNGYSDYTADPLLTTTLQAGASYSCIVSAGEYPESYAAWIDYNDDGVFANPSERIGFTSSPVAGSGIPGELGSSASFPIVLSCAPPVGVHRLRVRAMYNIAGSAMTPCGNNSYGEVEDYLVTITAADPCPKPTGLAITAASLTTTTATATWVQGCAETVWDAHVGAVGAGAPTGTISNANLSAATVTFSGLLPATNYEYYVRSVCDAGTSLFSGWSGPFAFRTQGVPTCATALVPAAAATGVALTQVLSWTAPAGANPAVSGYDVYFGTSPGSLTPISSDQIDTTYTPEALELNTTYYWKVVAINSAGFAVGCTEQSFTTTSIVTYCAPTTTFGCADGDVIAKVILNTLVNDSGTGCPSDPVPGNDGAGLNGNGYSDYTADPLLTTTLQAGGSYSCIVSAGEYPESYAAWIDYNDDGVFANPSERIGFTSTPVAGSGSPGVLGSSASFPIVLSCAPPVGVHRLRVRAMYNIAGSAMTPCGNNDYGEVEDYLVTITAADPCPKPSTLAVTLATTTSATLGWKKGCVETEWDVHVQQVGGGAPVGTPSNSGVTSTSGPNFGTLAVSGLTAGSPYEFYVRAVCDASSNIYSDWTGPFTFISVAPGCTTLNSPANLAEGVAIGTVPFSWSAPVVTATQSAATSYDVFFSTTPNSAVTPLGNTTSTSVNITNVTFGTYYVLILAKNAAGSAIGCVETSFTTVPAPPTVSDQVFCNSATVADFVAQGTAVQWYTASTGGAPLSSSTVLTNGTYYASQVVGGFESTRTGVSVTINPLSVSGTVSLSATSICPGNTATLSVSGNTGIVQWQYSLDGTTGWTPILGTSSTSINTGAIPVTTHYRAVVTSGVCTSATSNTVMLTVVIPAAPATAPQILPLTSTVASLQATGSSISWYSVATGGLTLSSSTPLVSGNTYFASQTINGCEGDSRGASLVTLSGIPASKIRSTQCGSTLAALNSNINADIVTGATMYRFQVTNGATVNTIELNKYSFKLTQMVGINYGTTYSIRVAAKLFGDWGPYGTSCNVTTPTISSSSSVPTTKIRANQCGTTLASIGSPIVSELVYGAEAYRFQLTNGETVTEVESPIYYFFLTNTAIGTYGTTFSVKTKAKIGGIWGEYGAACSVSTPALVINTVPTTQVRPSFCGTTLAKLTTKIPAVIVYNAEGYRFEITRAGVITVFDTTSYNPALAETGVIVSTGTVYAIRVAAKVNGVYGSYGVSCNVTTPVGSGNSKQIAENTDFSLAAYPNPSNSTFHLEVNGINDDEVSILVFDMMGRQIENKVVKSNDIENISLGQNYSTGVYNVIVSQGMNTKSVRLVKK